MTFEQQLAAQVRAAMDAIPDVREVKMFGGIGFLLNDNLLAAASRRGLLVRVGKAQRDDALRQPGTRPMVMRDRVMEGYVYVDPSGMTDRAVAAWIRMAVDFVATLPAGAARSDAKRKTPRAKSSGTAPTPGATPKAAARARRAKPRR